MIYYIFILVTISSGAYYTNFSFENAVDTFEEVEAITPSSSSTISIIVVRYVRGVQPSAFGMVELKYGTVNQSIQHHGYAWHIGVGAGTSGVRF